MSSADVFYGIGDAMYAFFESTLEPMGDRFWQATLIFGFVCFFYWMKRQVDYNKIAKNDSNQIK